MNLPIDEDDEVVGATRYARDSANGVEEQMIIITRLGQMLSLTYNPTLKEWTCRHAKIKVV